MWYCLPAFVKLLHHILVKVILFLFLQVMGSIFSSIRDISSWALCFRLKGRGGKGTPVWKTTCCSNIDKPIKVLTNKFADSDHAGLFFSVVNVRPLGISPK